MDSSPVVSCSPPAHTALPFPVARHRSHHPDLTSISRSATRESKESNAQIYGDESEIVPNFQEIEAFAFPLEKKLKKNLDFYGGKKRAAHLPLTLEGEIDSENRSLLMRMSEDEISDARVEIMDRFNPRLVQFLQKRGNDKVKKKNNFNLDELSISDQKTLSSSENKLHGHAEFTQQKKGDSTQMWLKSISSGMTNNPSDGFPDNSRKDHNIWSVWSERVEAVRGIRFSLDGTISENYVELSNNGKNCSGYNSDKIVERDYLRTEGDPGSVGYTIKEAVSLTRSVIPGQRTIALHLLTAVLDKARYNIIQIPVGQTIRHREVFKIPEMVDWEAVWAYALGPEPELALSLRLCLDDNHNSVVLASVKAICSALNTDINESYFDVSEKVPIYDQDICTAPVFRSKPVVDSGFLCGGFWKHSAKRSNIFQSDIDPADDNSKNPTVSDDIVVSGQDFSAGLVRMGILPRICFLLEEDHSTVLGERLLYVLISIARHSSTCAHAVFQYPDLIKTLVNRFTVESLMEAYPYLIKSITLFKVLAKYDRKICLNMVNTGLFGDVTRNLYSPSSFLEKCPKSGENAKFSPCLMVEQLRFWRVVVSFGIGASYFEYFASTIHPWLLPTALIEPVTNKVHPEFFSISAEVYLVMAAMARRLPDCYSHSEIEEDRSFSWKHAWEMVDIALKWLSSRDLSNDVKSIHHHHHQSTVPLLWVVSSVNYFLSCVLERLFPYKAQEHSTQGREYVMKIKNGIVKSCFMDFELTKPGQNGSFFAGLCRLFGDDQSSIELSLASVGCLYGISRVIFLVDKVLEDGLLRFHLKEFRPLLDLLMEKVSSKWKVVQSIESFGRGGPSPGVGLGWGAAGGGFWSEYVMLAQAEATVLIKLLFMMTSSVWEDGNFISKMINAVVSTSLILGPRDVNIFGEVLDLLFRVPTMAHIGVCIQKFLDSNSTMKSFDWGYTDDDYRNLGQALAHHYSNRWRKEKKGFHRYGGRSGNNLDSIPEEGDEFSSSNSLCKMWVHGRFPLPINWYFSPITTLEKDSAIYNSSGQDFWEVEGGLLFILGAEIISPSSGAPACHISLTWKLHSLSMILLSGMAVLERESRDIYETLQDLYGQHLSELRVRGEVGEALRFQKDVNESYPVFVEGVVEQFGAVSYGHFLFGRQVAVYLCRPVEPPVRLSAWNALLDTHTLGLLPSLDNCLGSSECYLEPVEDNDAILEAYVRSWVSGDLDKAAVNGSVAYSIVLHHVSSFIFEFGSPHKNTVLRNRMVKSLLRDCFRKEHKKDMMIELVKYCSNKRSGKGKAMGAERWGERMQILRDACEANSTLLTLLQQLHSFASNHL